MSQWKLYANAAANTSGPVQTWAYQFGQGSGKTNLSANNKAFANGTNSSTPGAAIQAATQSGSTVDENWVVGQFAVTAAAANSTNKANTSGDAAKVHMPGWVTRRAYEGPILALGAGATVNTVANGVAGNAGLLSTANAGTGFANGETALISGGTVNANVTILANTFMNLTNLSVTGNTGGLASANAITNGSYIVVSNGAIVNAVVVVFTDANGSVTNTLIQAGQYITQAGGYYPTGTVNGNLVISLYSNAGVLLNHANSGSALPTSLPGGNLTFVANLSAVAAGITNATLVGASGLFPNTSQSLASTANGYNVTFNRETHVIKMNIGANGSAFTNLPAANTPVTVTVSNTGIAYGQAAVGTFVSNIATGITNTVLQLITWGGANTPPFANNTGYWGLFGNTQANTATPLVIVFTNANGQVIANGGATFSANLGTSSGGTISINQLGGRAGRVQYETIVASRFIANGGLAGNAYVNVATLTVTGNTGGLASANSLANGDTIVISNGALVNAVATIVTDANGSLQNSGITLAWSNGYVGGNFPAGTTNSAPGFVINVVSPTGVLLNHANIGSPLPTSAPGGNLTFGGTTGSVAANASQYFPQ